MSWWDFLGGRIATAGVVVVLVWVPLAVCVRRCVANGRWVQDE